MCAAWLLVAAVIVGVARGAVGQCWENPICQDLGSENSILECIQLCRSDLTNEKPAFPGHAHLQPFDQSSEQQQPSSDEFNQSEAAEQEDPDETNSESPQIKRSYSMEHFRWGKPVGRKRRPIKTFTAGDINEIKSALNLNSALDQGEILRRDLTDNNVLLPAAVKKQKDNVAYKMKHFRWSSPASKRYGGFMKSWDGHSQKPLISLFKSVINKDGFKEV